MQMNLLVCADDAQLKELRDSSDHEPGNCTWLHHAGSTDTKGFDVIFLLNGLPGKSFWKDNESKIIFLSEVIRTNKELQLPASAIRINGWPGFLGRKVWEGAGNISDRAREAAAVFGKELIQVRDVPGLVAARVVASIIAEGFSALEDGVSTKEEIDLALKLGTHYPFGPFEWNEKIGSENIAKLNRKISHQQD